MKKILIVIAFVLCAVVIIFWVVSKNKFNGSEERNRNPDVERTLATKFPSFNPNYMPPSDTPNLFELSQNYPDTYSADQPYPWVNINFKNEPQLYLQMVLNYCLEGNIEVDFKVQENKVRKWYHAPWLHDDGREAGNGREYLHGLTRERATPKFEIHPKQDVELENWAVGFYNEPGGYTIKKIWLTDSVPNPSLSNFPEGTVTFKLLFTDGTVDKVPFLADTKEWTANIYPCNPRTAACADSKKRINRTVSLMQIDVAVKDARAGETGWVFGTFIYDASRKGKNVWEKMAPVGLSWGDDFDVTSMINTEGAFLNADLKQSYLNPDLIEVKDRVYTNEAYMRHHGLGGRLNGPIDNPISSCISCHARAAITQSGEPASQFSSLTRPTYTIPEFKKYFSTINGGANLIQIDSKTYTTTDYSLQITTGIRNFYKVNPNLRKADSVGSLNIEDLPEVTRGEK